jgi:hypothetical protein
MLMPGQETHCVLPQIAFLILQLSEAEIEICPNITMDIDNIPVADIIRYISLSTGLNYKIDEKSIVIGHCPDAMETKCF